MVSFDRKALLTLSHEVITRVMQQDAESLEPTVNTRRPEPDLDDYLAAYERSL